jgi:hypothetical protein
MNEQSPAMVPEMEVAMVMILGVSANWVMPL